VTITGTNDAAAIAGSATGAVTEDAAAQHTASGVLTVTDVDHGEASFRVPASLAGQYGAFAFTPATGQWGYALDDGKVQALAAAETTTDTLHVTSFDGTAGQDIVVTITGTNDAPVVAANLTDQSAVVGGSFSYVLPTNAFSDIDRGDQLTYVGSNLPSWLHFDPASRTYSGTPTRADAGDVTIGVTARDLSGAISAVNNLQIHVAAPTVETAAPETLVGTLHSDNLVGGAGDDVISGEPSLAAISAGLPAVAAGYLTRNGNSLVNNLGSVTDNGGTPIAQGLNPTFGEHVLPVSDDGSTYINLSALPVLNVGGVSFQGLYLNNNGNVSFGQPLAVVPPAFFAPNVPSLLAPFLGDVDTTGGAWTDPAVRAAIAAGNSTGSNRVYYDLDTANRVLTITWDDVGHFSAGGPAGSPNAFQMQIIWQGDNGDFDVVFRYEQINWTTNVGGATSVFVGFDPANGGHGFEALGSGADAHGLASLSNLTPANPGVQVFYFRDGLSGHGDTLTGGLGADTLSGGPGADRFVYNATNEGRDEITNFQHGVDTVAVSAGGFGLAAAGAVPFATFSSLGAATSASSHGYLFWTTSDEVLWWDPTGGDPSDAVALAHMPGAGLTASDVVAFVGGGGPLVSGPITAQAIEGASGGVRLDALANASGTSLSVAPSLTLPAGVTYDAASHSFVLDPTDPAFNHLAQGATQVVSVGYDVSNGSGLTHTSASWTITGTNDAPVADSQPSLLAYAGETFRFADPALHDPDDGAILTYGASNVPAWLTFDPVTHSFSGTPTANDVGTVVVDLTATDQFGASAVSKLQIQVGARASTAGADTLWGTASNDKLDGGAGDDVISGQGPGGPFVPVGLTTTAAAYITRQGGTLVNTLGAVTDDGGTAIAGHPTFGAHALPVMDDDYRAIDLGGMQIDFGGLYYSGLFLDNNGGVSFWEGLAGIRLADVPFPLNPMAGPILAPLWADVTTKGGAWTDPQILSQIAGGNSTGSNRVYYDVDTVNHVFTATWDDVGGYGANGANAFQLQIITTGADAVVIFRYEDVNWTVAGGAPARVGFNIGSPADLGRVGYSALGSDPSDTANLSRISNLSASDPGVQIYYLHAGQLSDCDTITGGAGSDTLTGGTGANLFVYNLASEGKDEITNFIGGMDKIAVSAAGFGSGLTAGGAAPFATFANLEAAASTDAHGYFFFTSSDEVLWWDPTGGDYSDAVALAHMPGAHLHGSDLLFI
ncbi:MAG: hypothetical protein JWQ52_1686, partial [Phenylobacterium sp.]|nr:hypothetical protein [Phenylobacterium sp.]